MMNTLVITIGRNTDGVPMPRSDWHRFRTTLHTELVLHSTVLQHPVPYDNQAGQWEGQTEDASTFVALVNEAALPALRAFCARLCEDYNQDAIGFIAVDGTAHLVTR